PGSITAAAAAAVAAPAAAAGAAAGARPLLAGLGLVDLQGAALDLGAVQGGDGGVAALAHLDEAEAARAAGVAVGRHLGAGHRAVVGEPAAEVVRGGGVGEVPHINVLAHGSPFAGLR